MNLTQATSADYVQVKALQQLSATGIVVGWMGFTWIVSNRLLHPNVNETSCLAMTTSALGLAVNENMLIRIGEDPSKSYMNQVYAQFTAGAVRIEDEQIVHFYLAG
jgi:DNA-binding GntR family transcriptional regulator